MKIISVTPNFSEACTIYSVKQVEKIAKDCGYLFKVEKDEWATLSLTPYSLYSLTSDGLPCALMLTWYRKEYVIRDTLGHIVHSGIYHDNFLDYVVKYCKANNLNKPKEPALETQDVSDITILGDYEFGDSIFLPNDSISEISMTADNTPNPNLVLAEATVKAVLYGIQIAHRASGSPLRFDYSSNPGIGRVIAEQVAYILKLDDTQVKILQAVGGMHENDLVVNENETYIEWVSKTAAYLLTTKFTL